MSEIIPAGADDSVLLPDTPPPTPTKIAEGADQVANYVEMAQFRGRTMYLNYEGFPHWVTMDFTKFLQVAYPVLGGMGVSKMRDIFSYLSHVAVDLTPNDRYILFGHAQINDETGEAEGFPTVWDTRELHTITHIPPSQCVWRSPYSKTVPDSTYKPIQWILDIAGGSKEHYDDIMQSIAPLIMEKKPDGVIWWVGNGANGKSTLMDAIYRIFPGQLASINVKRLTDEKDTPSLNGKLANIVKESSEGRIEDTEIYKAIGTHENFRTHRFHSQDDIEIRGNMHHIFSANSIPAFNDKGHSTKRRTFIIPFNQQFDSDPDFEERTFTPEMFGELLMELGRYANQIKRQGYKYKWSAVTTGAKADYDAEASNAEQFAAELIACGLVAFDNFFFIRPQYENWCAENGYVPLGVKYMRKAFSAAGFERDGSPTAALANRKYFLPGLDKVDLLPMGIDKPGMYTAEGFEPEEPPKPQTQLDVAPVEEPKKKDIIGNRW